MEGIVIFCVKNKLKRKFTQRLSLFSPNEIFSKYFITSFYDLSFNTNCSDVDRKEYESFIKL